MGPKAREKGLCLQSRREGRDEPERDMKLKSEREYLGVILFQNLKTNEHDHKPIDSI